MAFLELEQIQKSFGTTFAVEAFNLAVEPGEFISFLGPSGCGKTTTLRMIAGFERPTNGQIRLAGADITHRDPNRRNIGMVFQSYALFPNMTVAQNIGFGLRLKHQSKEHISSRVGELLELIGLPDLGRRYPYQLSGGQQQRVALARALAIEPQVLLLDEPLSALDAKIRDSLRNQIRAIQRQLNITTIYVTHDQEEAMALSDRIVVMNKGRIEQIGTPFQTYNFPQTAFVASFVGTLNALRATVTDPVSGSFTIGQQQLTTQQALQSRRVGEEITVAIRPEVLSLSNGEAPNRLRGVVEDVTFLGAIVRVRAALEGQSLRFDLFNNPHLAIPTVGQTVTLAVPAESCLILDGPPPAAAEAAEVA